MIIGFFKNLFEKKTCDICGGEIGMLGNRKLEDGNYCKECAKKLSPWFTERKHSTVEENQTADRQPGGQPAGGSCLSQNQILWKNNDGLSG